jgi:hypothetical protein
MDTTRADGPDPAQREAPAEGEGGAVDGLPFPRYLIALVQDESEMLLQPAYDVFAFLDDQSDKRWDVELHTERTFEGLLRAEGQFDCIVVGLNVAMKSELVRAALSARLPNTGLCVLHQLRKGSVPFLKDDLGLDVEEFPQPVDRVVTAEKLPVADEILLNWPASLDLQVDEHDGPAAPQRLIGGEAFSGFTRQPTSRWRTVLEVETRGRRVPVLLRTPSDRHPPVVACSVLLRPGDPGHMELFGNILSLCVAGRPEALVVGDADSASDARLVHRKLRMQGTKAIAAHVDRDRPLDFTRWPYRGIRDVVLPEHLDPTMAEHWGEDDRTHAREWLKGGGRISRLGPGQRLTLTHRESDAHWVARRWATWFLSEPAAVWHGGSAHGEQHKGTLIGTRAVLRFLAALHGGDDERRRRQPGLLAADAVRVQLGAGGSEIVPGDFGLHPPEDFREPVTKLLRARIEANTPALGIRERVFGTDPRHIDYSVSTTCALLDVHALLGHQPLDAAAIARFERWLVEDQFPKAALDDKLEIARCLGDAELLEAALQALSGQLKRTRPLTAAVETKLREAIVACDVDATAIPEMARNRPTVVERALRKSPLLCANYLVALGDLRAHWKVREDDLRRSLAVPDPRAVDRAVIGLGRHGSLLPLEGGDGRLPHEMISTTALALLAFFGRHSVPTHVIRPEGQALPPDLVASVLNESERLRQENAIVVKQQNTIELASHLLAAVVAVLSVAVVVLLWWLGGSVLDVPVYGTLALTVVFTLAFAGAMRLLQRRDLAPPWGVNVAVLVIDGPAGLVKRVRTGLSGDDASASDDAR